MAVTMKRRSCSAAVEVLQRVAQPAAMPCSASPTCATSRARVGSGSTSSSPPAMRSASAASRASGCSTQRLRSTTTTTSAAPSAARPAPERDRPARGRALARHPQHARDARRGRRQTGGSLSSRALGSAPARVPAVSSSGLSARAILAARSSAAALASAHVGRSRPWRRRPSGRAGPRPRAPPGGARPRRAAAAVSSCGRAQHRDGLVAAVGLAPGLPPARRRPRGQARERGDRDHQGERDAEPDVQRQRAAHQPAAGGSKR